VLYIRISYKIAAYRLSKRHTFAHYSFLSYVFIDILLPGIMKPFEHQLEKSISLLNAEKQKKELLASIKYASYIQNALLPSKSAVKKICEDHVIFFQPRDIISGDFYWIQKRSNKIFWVVGDCTGHGVPGALMSVLGISMLNQVVHSNRFQSASDVLNQLREHIMRALHQTGKEQEQKDGIDMGLCIINTETKHIQFAGAYNSLYIIRDKHLHIIKGDRMPIGIHLFEEESFTTSEYSYKKSDMLYMFSDGFADQFGGEEHKKLKYPEFRKLLIKVSAMKCADQENYLSDYFYSWKANEKQVDDVLIMGLRM
jgi:serine phosphatase RsbU (regulator of sigma subunit)